MKVGMEKECLIFDENFNPLNVNISKLPKNVTLDYADHQLELVSDVFESIEELYCHMHKILDEPLITNANMWPLSQPGIIDYDIKTKGTNDKDTISYREGLTKKYSKQMLLISGIHFNISLEKQDIIDKETYYFDLMKKIYLYGPILQQFVSFTPKMYVSDDIESDYDSAISLRNTHKYGYYNEMNLGLDFTSFDTYQNSVEKAIENGVIQSRKELYAKVRYKESNDNPYLELRFIDLNPFYRLGISYENLHLIPTFIKYIDTLDIKKFDTNTVLQNFEDVNMYGQNKQIKLNINGKIDTLKNHTLELFTQIMEHEKNEPEVKIVEDILNDYLTNNTDLDKLIKELDTMSIDQFGKKNIFRNKQFKKTFEEYDLELSTKIVMNEAKEQGMNIEVLDELNNVIQIENEIIVQATKTNIDTYANILMLENKYMTKKILNEHNIPVPKGVRYQKGDKIDYNLFNENNMVVKPEDTNFGIGITMLTKKCSKESIDNAINFAFENSKKILVEETIIGTEYRFLVIGDKCVSIVKRVPAHVVGDGINTIKKLVSIKNKNPLRSTGYVTPVELINLGEFEKNFLKLSNLDENYIPRKDEIVNLRNNSNISTGGDTIEMLEQVPKVFHNIAIQATRALGVNICGIDMIIEDLFDSKKKYGIIEANFNPAIQMHTFPLVGYGKSPAKDIIELVVKKNNI